MRSKTEVFTLVDGLRGVAALVVYLFHSSAFFANSWAPASGYLAVDLFFLLSGIVIAHSYDQRIAHGDLRVVSFMCVRLVRFYPLLILATLLAFVIQIGATRTGHLPLVLVRDSLPLTLLLTLLLIPQRPVPDSTLFPLNAPYWSLLDELAINLCFIVAWRWLNKVVLVALIVVSGIALSLLSFQYGNLAGGPNWNTLHVGLVRVAFSFFLGVLMVRTVPYATRRSDVALLTALVAIGALLFIDPGRFRPTYDLVCVVLLFPSLALAALRFQAGARGSRPARWLGDASYGIYVFHAPFNGVILGVLGLLGLRQTGWLGLVWPAAAVLLIVIVLALNRHFDIPLRRWLLGSSRRPEPPPL